MADTPQHDTGRLARVQRELTAHLRKPAANPCPAGMDPMRAGLYRELLFNNLLQFLANGFPVLRSLCSDEEWDALVSDFLAEHRCKTPYFHRISQEFLTYVCEGRGTRPQDPPFLAELAHYEWVELALSLAEQDLDSLAADRDGDLLARVPLLSPLAWPLAYAYPVHRIGPEHRPTEADGERTHLLVYRDRQDDVHFMELNQVTARLLMLMIEEPPATGRELLARIAEELQHPDPAIVVQGGSAVLEDLRQRDVILGTRPEH